MSEPSEVLIESAKAVQEVSKTTSNAIDAAKQAGGFIAKFISGPLEQGMGIFEDKLRYMRWERQVRFMQRANEVLKEIGLTSPNKTIPLKIAIPLLQGASIEEDDSLQDRWVNLLVNAGNAGSHIEIHRSFIEVLSQINSLEAKILDVLYSLPFEKVRHQGIYTGDLPNSARLISDDERENLNNIKESLSEEVILALANLARVGCITGGLTWGGGESFNPVNVTVFGKAFVQACRIKST